MDSLKAETAEFVQSVMANPSNQALIRPGTVSNQASTLSNETDFAGILSGIYDLELPSIILAPVSDAQVLNPTARSIFP